MSGDTLRIARYLARCGAASRRGAEELVQAGRVRVNGEVALDLGRQIRPGVDRVVLDGKPLELEAENLTLMLNKPRRFVVTRDDPQGRRTIYELLPEEFAGMASKLVYVGRLDFLSEGLLLVTTDGELVHRVTHPSTHMEKEYHVRLERPPTEEEVARLRAGVDLSDGPARPVSVRVLEEGGGCLVAMVLVEGRNRIIRRMMEKLGISIQRLQRVRIGGLTLGHLPVGEWRRLGAGELERLTGRPGSPQDGR